MNVTIRKVADQDYQAVCDICEEIDALHRDQLPHFFQKPAGPNRRQAFLLEQIADDNVGLFVAEVAAEPAGLIHVAVRETPPIPVLLPRRFAIIDEVVVKEVYRGQGVGRLLMATADAWATAKGATSIELSVYEFNARAITFYEELGYTTLNRRMSKPLDAETRAG